MDRVRVGPVKGLKIAIAAFVLSVALFVVVTAGGIYFITAKSNEGSETHDAICALAADLETRSESSRRFLDEHPHGIPGIPAGVIRESLANQQRTINALSVVSC